MSIIHSAHTFTSLDDMSFSATDYSKLKFGDDVTAREFGYALADSFFEANVAECATHKFVVFSSPYNYVKNAATIMTEHFINRLNMQLYKVGGEAVSYSTIHRLISYTNDYGFLGASERKKLIDGDKFTFNPESVRDKIILFIDDVRITGTHEKKLYELLQQSGVSTEQARFLYFAQLTSAITPPGIEAELNFAAVRSVDDFTNMMSSAFKHHVIIRPIKYMMSLSVEQMKDLTLQLSVEDLYAAYYGAIAEGYYKVPQYRDAFIALETSLGQNIINKKG